MPHEPVSLFNQVEHAESTAFNISTSIEGYAALTSSRFQSLIESVSELDWGTEKESHVFKIIDQLGDELTLYMSTLTADKKKEFQNAFHGHIKTFAMQSDLCAHLIKKPLGYAGDYLAMEKIWQGRGLPHQYRYLGETVAGKTLNAYTLSTKNCMANESRVYRLREFILKDRYQSIASFGSGGAIEIEEACKIKSLSSKTLYLIDQDAQALSFAVNRLKPYDLKVISLHGNIFKEVLHLKAQSIDFLYASGVFDYLNVKVSRRMVPKMFEKVSKMGTLCITNAHPLNSTQVWMECISDWYLDYKNAEDMMGVAHNIDYRAVNLELDNSRVYQYLYVNKY